MCVWVTFRSGPDRNFPSIFRSKKEFVEDNLQERDIRNFPVLTRSEREKADDVSRSTEQTIHLFIALG